MSEHRFSEDGKIVMHWFWCLFWLAWMLGLLALAFMGFKNYPMAYAALWVIFFAGEGQGALRKRWAGEKGKRYHVGDTLSEFHWWFLQGEESRKWIGRASAASLAWAFGYAPWVFGDPKLVEVMTVEFMAVGLFFWLAAHFTHWNEIIYAEQDHDALDKP